MTDTTNLPAGREWVDPEDDDPTPPRCLDHDVDMVWEECPNCQGRGEYLFVEEECRVCDGWGGWFKCPVDGKRYYD